ncbi:hypothetical protein BOX15_Mlig018180g1 [Macrostomum lignano]|uniref:TNFR-Cys domain-containing protein n=1 Tax=Macrostomum lignano TaxID=282301 RepID=A0A267GUH6_9PLAT|nr:hypothetical protein BOX15_Mlig018180g1 [Macrostomum lignano]
MPQIQIFIIFLASFSAVPVQQAEISCPTGQYPDMFVCICVHCPTDCLTIEDKNSSSTAMLLRSFCAELRACGYCLTARDRAEGLQGSATAAGCGWRRRHSKTSLDATADADAADVSLVKKVTMWKVLCAISLATSAGAVAALVLLVIVQRRRWRQLPVDDKDAQLPHHASKQLLVV